MQMGVEHFKWIYDITGGLTTQDALPAPIPPLCNVSTCPVNLWFGALAGLTNPTSQYPCSGAQLAIEA